MAGTLDNQHKISTLKVPADDVTQTLAKDQGVEAFKDITFGSIAGIIGKTIEYPFDTVKVRLQSQPYPPIYSGPTDCFLQSLHSPEGGFRSLYRGVSAPFFGAAIETSSLFFCYRIAQSALQSLDPTLPQGKGDKLPLGALLACGAVSGAATSLLLTPIELVKCKLQYAVTTNGNNNNNNCTNSASQLQQRRNPLTVIASVFRQHGILGFWRGQLGTLIRETGGTAAWFGSYEGVLTALRRYTDAAASEASRETEEDAKPSSSSPVSHQLLAGASAGVAYNFMFFPADTIKSRMQTEEIASASSPSSTSSSSSAVSPNSSPSTKSPVTANKQSTFYRSGAELWQQQGLKGFYRGCGITVARSAPSSAVIFAVFEGLKGWAA
ncbi:MAG: hypothetical protein L6R37_003209 [Teloschistes peruensis]|nr:MAG: hypothetical protein L6R37_003209 [Teloschistes peruensis]